MILKFVKFIVSVILSEEFIASFLKRKYLLQIIIKPSICEIKNRT
jgi:hypothetical protein